MPHIRDIVRRRTGVKIRQRQRNNDRLEKLRRQMQSRGDLALSSISTRKNENMHQANEEYNRQRAHENYLNDILYQEYLWYPIDNDTEIEEYQILSYDDQQKSDASDTIGCKFGLYCFCEDCDE